MEIGDFFTCPECKAETRITDEDIDMMEILCGRCNYYFELSSDEE